MLASREKNRVKKRFITRDVVLQCDIRWVEHDNYGNFIVIISILKSEDVARLKREGQGGNLPSFKAVRQRMMHVYRQRGTYRVATYTYA